MIAEKCSRCGNCTAHCEFLKKHGMDLFAFEAEKPELCMECMLCGDCSRRCPEGIDGRRLALTLREKLYDEGVIPGRPYKAVLMEKKDYVFRKYPKGTFDTVLFPGCNFPSFFPGTTEKLAVMFKEKLNAGIAFDCCGKPIAEIGMRDEAKRIIQGIDQRLASLKARELVTVCPNCYYFLKDQLQVKVVDIYEKLLEMGIKPLKDMAETEVFVPCPDRGNLEILQHINRLYGYADGLKPIEDIQCCGLGGLAACIDKDVPAAMTAKLKEKGHGKILTYCATCYGNFSRNGLQSKHLLPDLLGMEEPVPKGLGSVINRASFRFKKR